MSKDGFFFEKKVGVLESMNMEPTFTEAPHANIEMVQNGYKLHYEGKTFITVTLKEALGMIESWMEKARKAAEKKSGSDHEESGSSHES